MEVCLEANSEKTKPMFMENQNIQISNKRLNYQNCFHTNTWHTAGSVLTISDLLYRGFQGKRKFETPNSPKKFNHIFKLFTICGRGKEIQKNKYQQN
jgi:hypothetical protein